MEHKLIKTDNYLLVGSNDDLRRGWFYCVRKNDIFQDEGEDRSEERRVGKEFNQVCITRWSPGH